MGHYSDCAVHSAPAYPAGECDCGYSLVEQLNEGCDADKRTVKQCNALLMCLCQEAADEIERLREQLSTTTAEREKLVEFVNEVRRTGDTRLASMAIATLAKLGADKEE